MLIARVEEAALHLQAAALEAVAAGMVITNREGTILWINPYFTELTGYTSEEAVGQNVRILKSGKEDQAFYKNLWSTILSGKVWHGELTNRRKDGTLYVEEMTISPVWEGAAIGNFVALKQDVTQRKRAEEERRFTEVVLSTQMEASIDGILVVDEHAEILSFNRQFMELWEIPAAVMESRSDERALESVLAKVSAPEEFLQRVKCIDQSREKTAMEDIPLKDGRTFNRYSAPMVGSEGRYYGRIWYFRDITLRKQAEQKLSRTLSALEHSNQELEQFAYVASHDLQEPLRMVSSYTQLLSRRYQGKLDAAADEFIGYAVDGANRMQRLIEDLLAYSRLNTRSHKPESTDSSAVLEQGLANLTAAIEESGAVVTHDALPSVLVDKLQLAQLFQNLIGNAIKFHADKPPRIQVSAERKGEEWVFAVRDNGIGIDPQYAGRIFTIFQRLHTREEYPGTGIGLAICKKIVERRGGRIWVESQLGMGSTFYFTIPVGSNEQ